MDDTPLRPVSPVTMQVMNGLIESQTKLRDAAEKRWSFARESLFNLARLVAADWLEERQHKKGGLEVVRIEELSQIVFDRVAALYSAHIHPDAEQMRKVLARIDALHQDVEKFTLLANGYKGELDNANLEITRLKIQADDKKSKPAVKVIDAVVRNVAPTAFREVIPPEPFASEFQASSPEPSWFQEWKAAEGFEKQSFIIRVMGDTGLSLRPEIMKALTDKYQVARTSGAALRAFEHLVDIEFIRTAETEGGLNGRPPQTVRLERLGESAYILLTGKQPVRAEFDEIRSAHGSDAHTLLVLKASTILESEGYQILSKGEMAFTLPDGRTTSPDIWAKKNGKELYIEVERDSRKGDTTARESKWQNAFDAGQGYLYVFSETESLQKRLAQEIRHALASEARLERANLYMTNLDAIAANQRHPDGSIWVSQKKP